ncbi:sulfatase-like hydrolase/transferase [Rhodobacteraceae bacterium]|nr:sulfatase-like hydrolase/transferase [Paracoccaceae bacterium]
MAANVLFILSDEHNRDISGCYGNGIVQTPNIDALSARGVTFDNAYCNSPICVPSRASLATGDYPHRTRFWDNAHPYDGSVRTWHHALRAAGHEVSSIGKLHYRSAEDDAGFSEIINPIYVPDGQGDIIGLLRGDGKPRKAASAMADKAGSGTSDYSDFDGRVADAAVSWLGERGRTSDKPWALYVSFVIPHFPLIAPKKFFERYKDAQIPLPDQYDPAERPSHPGVDAYRTVFNYDDYFDDASLRVALQAYYGMCSYLDHNVGRVLSALSTAGLTDDTLVIYASDHGESLGNRGLWGKSVFYEDSAAIPMIMAGPGVDEGTRCATPVSLVDVYPTIVRAAGCDLDKRERELPGSDLRVLAQVEPEDRVVFSEYHAAGSTSGGFMVRKRHWKLVYYAGHPSQIFDLKNDPRETTDLGGSPEIAEIQAELEADLRKIVDPDAANVQAFADQGQRINELGGEEAIRAKAEIGYTPAPKQ